MTKNSTLPKLLVLGTLASALSLTLGCDTGESPELDDEFADADADLREGNLPGPAASKWRIRNAAVQANTGQWVIREMAFCADAECDNPLTDGVAFDSGDSQSWSLPANAFDGDTATMWKTFDTDVAGQSYIGLDFGEPTSVAGLRLQGDNVVYSVDSIYVEYYDEAAQEWVTADYLAKLPAQATSTRAVQAREAFPTQWRVRNAAVQENTGQIVVREMAFCADAECAEPLTDGVAFDSGDSQSWSLPANAFDGETTTMWKTFDADVEGQSHLGMDFGEITEIGGLSIQTDNVVYSVDAMYVEYYDIVAEQWVTYDYLGKLPASSDLVRPLAQRERFPTRWRVRNAAVQENSGQIVVREMAFCEDAGCLSPRTDGEAFDSGDSRSWSLPANAFDGDTSTMWKTFDADVLGQSHLGMDFGELFEPEGVSIQTDNVVYSVDAMYVEYYDVVAKQWVSADYLGDLPASTTLTRPLLGAVTLDPISSLLLDDSGANASDGDPASVVGGALFSTEAAPITTYNRGALELDGVSGYATLPNGPDVSYGDEDFTVALWVRADEQLDLSKPDNDVVEKWSGGGGYPFVIRYINQNSGNFGKIVAARYDGSKHPSVLSTTTINDGQFHHVAFVKSGDALRLYIDGQQQGGDVTDTTGPNTHNDSPLYIGRRGAAAPYDNFFAGAVDDLNIFDRGLSQAQIEALMAR